jgi:hypothetical protein
MSGQKLALPRQRGVVAHQGNSAEARFLRWYAEYPNKKAVHAARTAYARALKVADPHDPDNAEALLLEGLRRFKFSPDPQYRPHPATWLNQRRWEDEAPETQFDSTLAAAGLKPEDFR